MPSLKDWRVMLGLVFLQNLIIGQMDSGTFLSSLNFNIPPRHTSSSHITSLLDVWNTFYHFYSPISSICGNSLRGNHADLFFKRMPSFRSEICRSVYLLKWISCNSELNNLIFVLSLIFRIYQCGFWALIVGPQKKRIQINFSNVICPWFEYSVCCKLPE